MPHDCRLGQLPVELLHILFSYFSAHELLLIFLGVSKYINSILYSYSAYKFDFKSIQKDHFDLVCRHIKPEQVVSLTLSDDTDTPGESELFLSRFQIEQFTQLRSLTLTMIEFESLKSIFSNLHKLNLLRSLSFDAAIIRYQYKDQIYDLNSLLSNTYAHALSRLRCLHLNKEILLILLPRAQFHLSKLKICSSKELKIILQRSSQLKSLSICLNMHRSTFDLILPSNRLTELNLEIEHKNVSMDEMKRFLCALPHLKHLELKTNGLPDLFDGYRWQALTETLITFNFKFDGTYFQIENTLETFRTPFWLEEKRWFVAYQDYCIFTIPHFASDSIDLSEELLIHSTAPNNTYLYNNVNKIMINTPVIQHNHYFTQIKTLELKCSISFEIILSVVDLNQIKHLCLSSMDNLLIFIPLKSKMPQLRELSIENNVTSDMIERIRHYRFKQILKLEIGITSEHSDYIIEELFILFPFIQHLTYLPLIHSKSIMIRLIDGFKYLSNASFYPDLYFSMDEFKFDPNSKSIIEYSQRLTKDNFICRVYHFPPINLLFIIHWWIGEQSSTHFQLMHWLPRRGYYWYRLKYMLLPAS